MYLKQIELRGFKSFDASTDFLLAPGVTGIVGPNGSGKSNVVDALRWVLGEQSSKALRGSNMQDVIFKGTKSRPRRNLCEVSLVFDNADHGLDTDYSEVRVTRRISRTGESTYLLNGTPCRLRDVVTLFMDTGIGRDGYSIVGQGRIHQILDDRASERRSVFEEASGIMKYRSAREDAEKNLEKTRANIARVDDLRSELAEQEEPARVQMESAKRYLSLSSELRQLEVSMLVAEYEKACKRGSDAQAKLNDLAARRKEVQTKRDRLENSLRSLQKEIEAAEDAQRAAAERASEAERMAEAASGKRAVEEERIRSARKELDEVRKLTKEQNAGIREAEAEIRVRSKEEAETRAQIRQVCAGKLEPLQQELEASSCQDEKMDNFSLNDLETESAGLREKALSLRVEAGEVRGRMQAAGETAGQSERTQQECCQLAAEAQRALGEAEANARRAAVSMADADARRRDAQDVLQKTEEELRRELGAFAAAQARTEILERSAREYEGYYESVRRLMRDSAHSTEIRRRLIGVVAECIAVKPGYETAVETALGSASQNVIVPDDESARWLVSYLREHRYGRITFLPADALRIRTLSTAEQEILGADGILCAASDAVSCSKDVRPAVEYLLGRTVVTENLESALRLKREGRNTFRMVTRLGEIVSSGGAITGGIPEKSRQSFLARRHELDRAAAEVRRIRERCENLRGQRQECEQALQTAQDEEQDALSALASARAQFEQRRSEAEQAAARREHAQEQALAASRELRELGQKLDWLENSASAAESKSDTLDELAAARRAEIAADVQAANQKAIHAADLRVRISAVEKEISELDSRMRLSGAEAERAKKDKENRLKLLRQLEARGQEAAHVLASAEQARSAAETARAEHEAAAGRTRQHLEDGLASLADLRRQRSEVEECLHSAEDQDRRLEGDEYSARAEVERADEQRTNCADRLWNDFELTIGNARHETGELPPRREAAERIRSIRSEIRAMGPVNPAAPEEYEALASRLGELSTQADDLRAAEADLESLVSDLTDGMERIFRERLAQINTNFARSFAELFGGGTASLGLEPGRQVMEAGIEIQAEPPGKKLQNLSLMSGGERALTAIALILAMLEVNPAPVCILDEIDAPLDDHNVENLARYLKKLASGLQFIVITHKKTTMAACDALYGITMHEKGVSDVVSVRLAQEG